MYLHIYDRAFSWIPEGSRVLDLGTGDGTFLERLVREKRVIGEGVEQNPEMVMRCIEKGLTVHQGDVLDGLDQYGDDSFDIALLIGTFQELVYPHRVIREAFRVARRILVAYHNFAYWKIRLRLVVEGRVPVTVSMPDQWYDTPNRNYCSIMDFKNMCFSQGFVEEQCDYFNSSTSMRLWPNLMAEEVLTSLMLRR